MCGCAGKTALETVVRPARRRLRARFAEDPIGLAGDLDAGLIPRMTRLHRQTTVVSADDAGGSSKDGATVGPGHPETVEERPGRRYVLLATFADPTTGSSPKSFASHVGRVLESLSPGFPLTLVKGHSVQLPGVDVSTSWCEQLRTGSERVPGFHVASIDVIHALPDLSHATQLAIACRHAANDCYAFGAWNDIVVRPLVVAPASAERRLGPDTVERWHHSVAGADVSTLEPAVVRHGGDRWLFGATVTAGLAHRPPIRADHVEAGDVVLIHRPLGAVAAYTFAIERDGSAALRQRATAELLRDHQPVAEVIAEFCPEPGESFDPRRHVKLSTDISGPGLHSVSECLQRTGHGLHLEQLPFLWPDLVRQARAEWLLPDATIGLNGPIAVVATADVVERFSERLRRDAAVEPVRIGTVTEDPTSPLATADGVDLPFYVERAARSRQR